MFSRISHRILRRRLLVFALGVLMALITQLPAAGAPLMQAGAPVADSATANAQLFLPVIAKAPSKDWPMLAANPARTSWTQEEVRGNLNVEWYRPIEPYIPTKVQPIAANGKIYVSTSRGLYAFNAANGNLDWVFPTELPLGHSPTIATVNNRSVAYVGSYDHRIYAIDALTGQPISGYAPYEAGAGFETNPVVVNNTIYAGNRDGNFYALDAVTGSLKWKYATGGPILFSAAYKDGTLYFASEDSFAYALTANDGALVWESAKLLGAGFHSFWPVIYSNKQTHQDYVVFSGSENYRVERALSAGGQGIFSALADYLFPGCSTGHCGTGSLIGPETNAAISDTYWYAGTDLIDASKISTYYETYPYRRVVFMLDRQTGQEYTFDSNGNGVPEYAPFTYSGATYSGNKYPPLVNGYDGIPYQHTAYMSDPWIIRGDIVGWKPGSHFVSRVAPVSVGHAVDEPMAFSSGGKIIYWSLCCDREAGAFDITIPYGRANRSWNYYSYNLMSRFPDYDPMYDDGDPTTYNNGNGFQVYSGKNQSKNGVYGKHGTTQSPPIPYQGRLYMLRGNTLMAWSPTARAATRLPLASIVSTASTPSSVTSDNLKQTLAAEIQKMIAAGHLRPGYDPVSNISNQYVLGEIFDYFQNPSDTVVTLLQALPYLSPALQTQVKTYLQTNYGPGASYDFTRIVHVGWNTGAPRDAFDIPPDMWASKYSTFGKRTTPLCSSCGYWTNFPPYNFYAAWKYAHEFGNAKGIFDSMSGKLETPPSDSYLTYHPYILNLYIAGYWGYLNLQQLAGYPQAQGIQKTYNHLLYLRVTGFSKDTPFWPDSAYSRSNTFVDYNRSLSVARNFMFLTPELGDYMHQNINPQVQAAVDEYTYVAPYWFVSKFDNTTGESTIQHLYDSPALFQAKAYILKQPLSELGKWIDVPAFAVGDLFYIQNLVAALSAAQ